MTSSSNSTQTPAEAINTVILFLTSYSFFAGAEGWVALALTLTYLSLGIFLAYRFPKVHINVKVFVFAMWFLHFMMFVDVTYRLF